MEEPNQLQKHPNLQQNLHAITACSSTQLSNAAICNLEDIQVWNEINSVVEGSTTENRLVGLSHHHSDAGASDFNAQATTVPFYDIFSPPESPVFQLQNLSTIQNHTLDFNFGPTPLTISEHNHQLMPDNIARTAISNEEFSAEYLEPSIDELTSIQDFNFNQTHISHFLSDNNMHLSSKPKSHQRLQSSELPTTILDSKTAFTMTTLTIVDKSPIMEKKELSPPKTNFSKEAMKLKKKFKERETHHRSLSSRRQFRPYACQTDGCESKFCRADELRRHMRMHTGSLAA